MSVRPIRFDTIYFFAALTVSPLADARAQERPDSAKSTLSVITVTASRSGLGLHATALAITQLTKLSWQGKSGYGLDDALSLVPGVLAQSRYGNGDVRLSIRGFGSRGAGDRSNSGTSRGIRLLLNGIPETEPDGRTSLDGFDLGTAEGIEVVRSNASALWGNAAGGVINVSTIPSFTAPFAEQQSVVGGFGLKRFSLKGGTLFGPARAFGTIVNSSFDGWRKNSMSSRTILDGGLVAPLGDRTTFRALLMVSLNRFNIPGPLTQAQVDADPSQANATYLSRLERRDNKVARVGLTLDHAIDADQGFSVMTFVTPKYLQRSERGTYRDFNRYHVGGNGVYRISGNYADNVRGTLSVGSDLAYQDGTILFYGLTPQGTRATDLRDNKREGANNAGIFINDNIAFGDQWALSLGARYDAITYTYSSNITPKLNTTKSFTGVTPKVGLTYRLGATHSVYASVGGGVEAPAGNETDPASTFGQDTVYNINPLLDPVRSVTYEIGTRRVVISSVGPFAEWSYDVAAFLTDVKNEIVPYRGGRFYFTAAKAQRTGIEAGTSLRTKDGWLLQGAVTMMNARYKNYLVDSVHYDKTKAGRFANYSNNEVVGVPDLTLNAAVSYAPDVFDGLRVRAGVQHTSKYWIDDANTVRVPSATVYSAGLTTDRAYDLGNGFGVRGSIIVNNLTDTRFIGSAFLNPDIVNNVPLAYEPGLPRQVLLSLSFERR